MFSWLFSDPLPVGQHAPDIFTLLDQGTGSPVSLTALRGNNVVLVFDPADETTLCTKQLCEFRDSSTPESKHAIILGINPADQSKHAKFRANHGFPLPCRPIRTMRRCAISHQGPHRETHRIPDRKSGKIRYAKRGKPDPEEVLATAE